MITRTLTAMGIREDHPYRRYWHSLRHSATNWLIILTGLLLYNGLNTIALIVIAPRVSKIEYGQYLACFALASFLVVIPGLGLDAWVLTQSPSDKASATALWMSTVRVRLVLLLVWLMGMMGLAIYLPADTYPLAILVPTVVGVALDQILLLSYSAMRIQGNHKLVTVVQSLSSLALLGLAWLLPLSEGQINRFALARTGLSFLAAALLLLILYLNYQQKPSFLTPARELIRLSRPFLWSEFATAVYVRADITIISLILGSLATSVYGPAINILQATFLAPRALFFFIVPILSRTYQHQRTRFARQSVAQFVGQGVVGLGLSIFLFSLAPVIITLLYKERYASSGEVLRWLSPIPLLRGLNFALGAILTSGGRQSPRTKVQIAAAIFNVCANLLIIQSYRVIGIAVVYVLTELILTVGYLAIAWLLVRQKIKRTPTRSA